MHLKLQRENCTSIVAFIRKTNELLPFYGFYNLEEWRSHLTEFHLFYYFNIKKIDYVDKINFSNNFQYFIT